MLCEFVMIEVLGGWGDDEISLPCWSLLGCIDRDDGAPARDLVLDMPLSAREVCRGIAHGIS